MRRYPQDGSQLLVVEEEGDLRVKVWDGEGRQ